MCFVALLAFPACQRAREYEIKPYRGRRIQHIQQELERARQQTSWWYKQVKSLELALEKAEVEGIEREVTAFERELKGVDTDPVALNRIVKARSNGLFEAERGRLSEMIESSEGSKESAQRVLDRILRVITQVRQLQRSYEGPASPA